MPVATPILTNKEQGPQSVPGPHLAYICPAKLPPPAPNQMLSPILLTGSLPSPSFPAVQGRALSGNMVSGSVIAMIQSAKIYTQNICMGVCKLWSYASVYCNTRSL